jgi:hypothetical protein
MESEMACMRSASRCTALMLLLVVAGCGGHPTASAAAKSQPPTGTIAPNLPPGVCAPTYQQVTDPNATRIEAKLVTRDTLTKSDPDFPPTWNTNATYLWVVAKAGSFTGDGPMPPGETPPTLHNAVSILDATIDLINPESVTSPCQTGIVFTGGEGPTWPTWFDQMTATDDVKIR